MSAKQLDAEQRDALESLYTFRRSAGLEFEPIPGNYDAEHLKAIHHHIFQDLPGLGFTGVTPGQFRPAVTGHQDWVKHRALDGLAETSHVDYSRMDKASVDALASTFAKANPKTLSSLKTAEFTAAIADIYTQLDYTHCFNDGNSRTLRAFTRQLSKESGYELDWSRFNEKPAGRNVLYIARDLSVNQIAITKTQHPDTTRSIQFTLDQFGGNRDLSNLMQDAIRPTRTIAFEKLPERIALQKHPELAEAYQVVHAAERYFSKLMPDDKHKQSLGVLAASNIVQKQLDRGETSGFQDKARERPAEKKISPVRQKQAPHRTGKPPEQER